MRKPLVLIADDDANLRRLLGFALRHEFDVLLTSDGQEAIDVYRKLHEKIDFVLLDVFMPGMTGPVALKEMQTINPCVRFCFTSGGHLNAAEGELVKNGEAFLLEKPFEFAHLPQILRQVMERAPRKLSA